MSHPNSTMASDDVKHAEGIADPHAMGDSKSKQEVVGDALVEPDASALSGFKLYAVAIGVSFGALMMSLDVSIIGTAIPSITSDFGDTSQIAWYPAAYTFATCVLTPIAGKMATSFPMKWVYLSFSFIFLIGSIICAAAPTSNAFIAGRAIAGIGAAGVASNGLTILITIAPPGKKPVFMGMGAGSFGIGLIIAPILGGVFSERATWRWCFWINLPLSAVTLTVVYMFLSATTPLPGKGITERILSLDLVGCGIFTPTVFMFLLAMNRGGKEDPWNSATIIGLFVGAGVMAALFVAWEARKGNAAMIPGNIVRRRTILCTILFAACHMGALVIASYYLPYWFQGVKDTDPIDSGVRILPTVLAQLISTGIGSGLAQKFQYYNPWFFLGGIFMCVANVLFTRFHPDTPSSEWIGYQVLLGIGAGFGMQMPSLAVQLELADTPELVPIGIALNMLSQFLGATITQVVAGTIFNNEIQHQLVDTIGLSEEQVGLFLAGGIKEAHSTAERYFPDLLEPIIEAYNTAITSAFYVSVAASALAFLLAFGIKWNKIGHV